MHDYICKGTISSGGLDQSWRKSTLNSLWKDWYWSSNTLAIWCEELTHWKRPWCWERLRAGEGATEDEMVGWHHWFNGHEFGWTPEVGNGEGGLACCGSWGRKESDTTEWLNSTELRVKKEWQKTQITTPSPHNIWPRIEGNSQKSSSESPIK